MSYSGGRDDIQYLHDAAEEACISESSASDIYQWQWLGEVYSLKLLQQLVHVNGPNKIERKWREHYGGAAYVQIIIVKHNKYMLLYYTYSRVLSCGVTASLSIQSRTRSTCIAAIKYLTVVCIETFHIIHYD